MKAYILVTGISFALLFFAHVARIIFEGWQNTVSSMFIVTSLVSLLITIWAVFLFLKLTANSKH